MTKEDDVRKFLEKARKQFAVLETNDSHNRIACRNNLNFVYEIGEGQWRQEDREARAENGQPCLTSNKLRKFVAAVANGERDQRLAGHVRPVDDKGDVLKANIIAGLIRHIEQASNAEKVYTNAGEQAIAGNVGYWRIESEELDDGFEQELFLREIKNQFSVHLDPDGMYGFIDEKLTKDEFKHKYPKANEESVDTNIDNSSQWHDGESLYVREYFYKERVKTKIVQASRPDASGQLEGESKTFEIPKDISEEELTAQGWVIEKEKTPKMFKVKWAKITASQRLEEGEWPGKDIPIIEVEGDWVWLEGKLYKRSLIESAKDDQRMYNYWKTSITERYALAIKAPYLVTVKMVEGLKAAWDVAHKKLMPFLKYHPDKMQPGGPRRELPPQIATGETSVLEVCNRDIEDTIGRYKSSFGQASNERTGVAIRERASRSEFSTFHFPDNFHRAIRKSTRQLIDLIPKIYDTQRAQRVLGEDGKWEMVPLNHTVTDEQSGKEVKLNDLSVGKYDLVEDVKLMSTRRQEMLQGMEALAGGNPMLGVLLAPHIAKAQDWDGAQEIAEDVKKYLPALLGIKDEGTQSESESETGGLL